MHQYQHLKMVNRQEDQKPVQMTIFKRRLDYVRQLILAHRLVVVVEVV